MENAANSSSDVAIAPGGCAGVGGGSAPDKPYPPPLATYEQVAADPALFLRTLECLHKSLGTKFMVPTIGGKVLDLHHLFVEVTSRGGIEKAINERRWRDVVATFSFPSTITSASFVLRKYYLSLLHPYEQIYYFQNKDTNIVKNDSSQNGGGLPPSMVAAQPKDNEISECQPAPVAAKSNDDLPPESLTLHPGCRLTGEIKGKFENGYIITVNVGSEKLKGVLYHVPLHSVEPPSVSSFGLQHCEKKRSRKAMKDPSRPKSHRSGYNFFFAEQCVKLKPLYSRDERAIKIGDMWNKLSVDEKEVYQRKGLEDVERYRMEMLDYMKSSSAPKSQ